MLSYTLEEVLMILTCNIIRDAEKNKVNTKKGKNNQVVYIDISLSKIISIGFSTLELDLPFTLLQISYTIWSYK